MRVGSSLARGQDLGIHVLRTPPEGRIGGPLAADPRTPLDTTRITSSRVMSRPRSLLLTLEDPPAEATVDGPAVLRKVIYNSLKDGGVNMDTLEGIECFSQTTWYIVFKTRIAKTEAKDTQIELYGKTYTLASTEYQRPRISYTWVRLYGFPLDTDSQYLEKTMSLYGELIAITDEIDGRLQIKTGVKLAQFTSVKGNIPSFIHVGRHRVRTAYRGQIKTCRNCHKEGHMVKDCTAGRVCKQCGEPGHTKADCPEKICFQCLGKGHEVHECPEYLRGFPSLEETTESTEQPDPRQNVETDLTPMTTDDPTCEQAGWGDETEPTSTESSHLTPTNHIPEHREVLTTTTETTDPAKETTTSTSAAIPPTNDAPPKISDHQPSDLAPTTVMETSPPSGEVTPVDPPIPPLPNDSTDSSGGEDEPPLKTSKTTRTTRLSAASPGKSGRMVTASSKKKKKKPKGNSPAVNVAGGRNRNPFTK